MGEPLLWRHVTLHTHSSWLHGSQRGFRSRKHRIHSSGDYRNLPPPGEHSGLLRYHLERSAPTTVLTHDVFAACGNAMVLNASEHGHNLRALSVSPTHVHFVIELPDNGARIKEIVGWMKWFATRAVRERTDEFDEVEIWAEGGGAKAIRDDSHLHSAIHYVLYKQEAGTWTWCPERGGSW